MRRMLCAVVALFLGGVLGAEEPLTNGDVIKLVKAGLTTETVIAKIEHSAARFDTSTDALIDLKEHGVPEPVIRLMVVRSAEARSAEEPSVAPAPAPVPAAVAKPATAASPTPSPAPTPAFKTRRFDEITVHSSKYAGCPNAELTVNASGIETTRCRGLDFKLKWAEIVSVCYTYGTRGIMEVSTRTAKHRLSTITPAEMKGIAETVRKASPQVPQTTNCE